MKRLIFLFASLILSYSNVNSQWNWNNPYPTSNIIHSIKFIDSNTGWLAGNCGTVFKTTNAGVNWDIQYTHITRNLNSIFFVDNNTGFACGEFNSLIKTTNGGNNWSTLLDSIDIHNFSVFFVNNNTGYLAGTIGLMKSTNSGLNWSLMQTGSSWFNDVYFKDVNTGWISGINGNIFYTSDAGNTWSRQTSPTNYNFNSFSFVSQNTGWITGNVLPMGSPPTNTIVRTTNGGLNWYSLLFQPNYAIFQINFVNENTGYGCGFYSNIDSMYAIVQKTTDGGNNWTTYKIFDNMIMYSIKSTGNAIWTAGHNIFKSTNDGANWIRETKGFYNHIMSIALFPSLNSIYLSGVKGFFAKSSNNGINWSEYPVSNSEYLSNMFFLNSNTGWASGFQGVYKTTNAGTNWSFYEVPNEQLTKLFFINENTGWVTSYIPNSVYKTTNGGLNWFVQLSTANLAFGIYFFNENTGLVGDCYGQIYRTTNGGNNWDTYSTGTSNWVADFDFIDSTTGYAVGELHSILKTTDAGKTWNQIYTRYYGSFYDVTFIRDGNNIPTRGYAVGTYQALYRTSDGGNNWYPMVSPTSNNLYEVKFINNYTGYIVGDLGTVLYTTNGGSTFVYNSSNSVPEKYVLHQNYPNPFNNSTIISFDVPKNSNVKIKLYNSLGKEMETLVNDFYQAGSYKISVWTGDYPSGVYFYRLETSSYSNTKKMVLIK